MLLALHTAVTAWPITADRMTEYLVKSAREADLHTSWTAPDEAYESGLGALAADLEVELGLDPDDPALGAVVNRTLRPGWANSLALLAVRLTSPGVPDLYQGTVSFTYSLVDPDNRVEPDWDERRALVTAATRPRRTWRLVGRRRRRGQSGRDHPAARPAASASVSVRVRGRTTCRSRSAGPTPIRCWRSLARRQARVHSWSPWSRCARPSRGTTPP